MRDAIHEQVRELFEKLGYAAPVDMSVPPDRSLGDIAVPCFSLAKEMKTNPVDLAKQIQDAYSDLFTKEESRESSLIDSVVATGPYVNIFLNYNELAFYVLSGITDGYGSHTFGEQKKVLVEYACPNPMKAFHIGHLRNTITGEAISRILEYVGYNVIRVNYQGDVGMHIAKSLWGIQELQDEFEEVRGKTVHEQVLFLGKAYATGASAFEENSEAKEEILSLNKLVYVKDESIIEIYELAREWSLEYFHTIYTKLGTTFDELYFESEVWERALEIVQEGKERGIFKEGDGAIIFPGNEYGLHDRVFITGEGNPTYEAKDLALSERRFQKHHPDKIIHIVGKEQTEYFKVVFAALEQTLPESKGKEMHLTGGFVQLKDGKMSSRKGKVILGEDVIRRAEEEVEHIMADRDVDEKDAVVERVAQAAIKYSLLKTDVTQDTLFDLQESVSVSGESGPYIQYIGARISSILKKAGNTQAAVDGPIDIDLCKEEKELLFALTGFPMVTKKAAEQLNTAGIAKYLFDVSQLFNSFYAACPILDAEDAVRSFRLCLCEKVQHVLREGLALLSIETVETM